MKKFIYILLAIIPTSIFAQYEKNIWYFGRQAGIDFSNNFPVALNNGIINTDEAAAVMNDSTGKLLFYTNSVTVWNSNHQIMENGENLMGCESASQVVIVPKPCIEDSIYYVFTIGCIEYNLFENGLRYSVIDLKYNNGLGKVIEKNILLHDSVAERITAVTHANTHDFWIVTHEWGNNNFVLFLLDYNGLNNNPSIISIGQPHTGLNMSSKCGFIKFSPNGKKLALTAGTILELYDFDNLTGSLYNCITFPNDSIGGGVLYGLAFSGNNTKLYVNRSAFPYAEIFQYDLTSNISSDIINSKITIFNDTVSSSTQFLTLGAMQLAPDKKIYVAHYTLGSGIGDTILGVINYPDSLGLSCLYYHNGLSLNGRYSVLSLPSFIETPFNYIRCNNFINDKDISSRIIENYPNPFNETTFLYLKKIHLPVEIFLYDIKGKEVSSLASIITEYSHEYYKIILSKNNLTQGLYILKIITKKENFSINLIIN